MGVCNCSLFCCTLLYVQSSIAIILMGKRELVALLNLSSWCLVMVVRLFLAMPRGCLRFVIVVFPDHTHLLFCTYLYSHCFIRLNIFVSGNEFGFNSNNTQLSKVFTFKCIRNQRNSHSLSEGFALIMLYLPVNSYVHVEMVSPPNHTFFLGKLD